MAKDSISPNNPSGVTRSQEPKKRTSRKENSAEKARKKEELELQRKNSKTLGKVAELLQKSIVATSGAVGGAVAGAAGGVVEEGTIANTAATRSFGMLSDFARESISFGKQFTQETGEVLNKVGDWGKSFVKGWKDKKKKKKKKVSRKSGKPTISEMEQTDRGAAFVGEKIQELIDTNEKIAEKSKKGGISEFIKNALMGIPGVGLLAKGARGTLGKVGKGVSKFASSRTATVMAGGASAFMFAKDAVKGVKKSEEWGVSKAGGALGAVLGGTESGIKGMFSNAGKWALLGFAIGNKVAPGIGGIIGGIAGAVIGGLLGWFGGEAIAKSLDKLGKWVSESMKKLWTGMKEGVGKAFNAIKAGAGKAFDFIKEFNIFNLINKYVIQPVFKSLGSFIENNKDAGGLKGALAGFMDKLGNALLGIFDNITFALSKIPIFSGLAKGSSAESHSFFSQMSRVAGKTVTEKDYNKMSAQEQADFNAIAEEHGIRQYATGGIASTPQIATLAEEGQPEWIIPEKYLPNSLTSGNFKKSVDSGNLGNTENLLKELIKTVEANSPSYIPIPVNDWSVIR